MPEEREKATANTGHDWDDAGPSAESIRGQLREQAREELERAVEKETGRLQSKVTDKLEGHLGDLRQQLDQAVNRATAEALKIKAAQMGQIKEMSEDPQSGSPTIVVEG